MIRVIALTQFAFVALGSIAVIVLTRAQTMPAVLGEGLRNFLATYTLWMLLVPIVWAIIARAILIKSSSAAATNVVQASGVMLTALLVATYGWLILSF